MTIFMWAFDPIGTLVTGLTAMRAASQFNKLFDKAKEAVSGLKGMSDVRTYETERGVYTTEEFLAHYRDV